jgi:glycosyltransferase involved in cell wall biosynthesis
MNLQDHVNLLGPKPNEEVIRLILESDLVVVPLQWTNEFGPMILVEAMSLAKPVVASNIGAIPELIQDGFNGFLAGPDSPGQFAEKMVWLLKNPELAKTMGEQAQKSVQRLYENDPTKEILDLYRSAATRGQ